MYCTVYVQYLPKNAFKFVTLSTAVLNGNGKGVIFLLMRFLFHYRFKPILIQFKRELQ